MLRAQPAGLLLCFAAVLAGSGSCKMTSAVGARSSAISSAYYHKPWKGYTTFYIHPDAPKGISLTALNQARICAAVTAQMIRVGLTRGDATADLVVNIVSVDSSKEGQHKGRPVNDWFRMFHGEGMGAAASSDDLLNGTLIPDSLLGADSAKTSMPKGTADSNRPAGKPRTPNPGDTAKAPAVQRPPDTGQSGNPAASRTAAGPQPPRYVYGALIVEVIDQKRRTLLWEGVGNQAVDVPMKDPDRRIGGIITRMMAGFSPNP